MARRVVMERHKLKRCRVCAQAFGPGVSSPYGKISDTQIGPRDSSGPISLSSPVMYRHEQSNM